MQHNLLTLKKAILFILLMAGFIIFIIYATKSPSNNRNWATDQQVLPYAVFKDGTVEIFNIRNFSYTTTSEYERNYYNKEYVISKLSSVDYIVEPFGSIGAAHTFVSFGFDNGDHIAISAEIRKEINESFSPLKGLLRKYELMYVIADERDVVKLRTNYRKDDVFIYPIQTAQENMQQLFIDMLTRANMLKEKPEFYNTLTNNCTTNIAKHINIISPNQNRIPWDIRLLLPENSDKLAYELGFIDNRITLEEARKKYQVNDAAQKYADYEDFPNLIRSE
jgi:hypothetical protein